jgi:enterochelin esterase family protein
MQLPRDAYLEYSYRLADERVHDPLNPKMTSNGMGGFQNWFAMPDFTETPLSVERSDIPRGTVTHHEVETRGYAIGETRGVHLYRPATNDPCPLLVVFDGQDYLDRGRIVPIVDNLIAEGRIRPINMALVDHGREARIIEYSCSDATVHFLQRIIVPLAETHLSILHDPALHGLLGASLGGLMALYTALNAPSYFGRVLSQSGAFIFGRDERSESLIYDVVRDADVPPCVWLDVGRYELLLGTNRHMHDLLVERKYPVTYREYNGGHNYTCWRNEVWRGIEAVYGL